MSIRLLSSILIAGVNQSVGTQLSLGADMEADLVNTGRAAWVSRPADPLAGPYARISTDASGTVTALVGPDGPVPLREPQVSAPGFELLPTDDITKWITDKTAALTVEVDNTVLFDGRPTIKITIPAGTSGVCKVGTNIANARMPYLWDRNDMAIATMYSGFTGYDYSSTYPPAPTVYFGNAAYADFWTVGSFYGANYPEHKMRADEWCVRKIAASEWGVGGGNPVANLTDGSGHIDEAALRMKLQWTQVSQATDCYIWIGFVGKMPARKKPTLIWSIDDGYDEWYTFIRPLMQHYDQPVTMAIASGYVDTSGYLTTAQIQEMFADPQRLFDFVNHSTDNSPRGTLGDAAYYANVQACRAFLRGIGVTGDGPLHHILVQGQWSNALVDLLAAGGYLTARGPAGVAMHGRDQLIRTGRDKMRWQLNKYGGSLDSTISLATAKASVDGIISNNIVGLFNAHRFAAAAGTDQWAYADMEQLVGYVASKVDADELEVKSLSRWHADLTGRVCALK